MNIEHEIALRDRERVQEFQRKHRIGLLTLLFTDIVGSAELKQRLGEQEGVSLIRGHHDLVRESLRTFAEAVEVSTAGDSFLVAFARPSDAVRFALELRRRLRAWSGETGQPVFDRFGIHVGEVFIEESADASKPKDLLGLQVDLCARLMSLGRANQVLVTRFAFDSARHILSGDHFAGIGKLSWVNHGLYVLKGVDEPVEICEIAEEVDGPPQSPGSSEKAHRLSAPDHELVLGWRPALEQSVPNTKWILEERLGEGGFGEVWLARHAVLNERRVFKFCFRADRVRSLKREVTLFRVLKERVGAHRNLVYLQDLFFDEPPYYLVMEFVPGRDLATWAKGQGGLEKVPLELRLEILAQAADGLQAAHDAGVIHRDIKPSNLLVKCSAAPGSPGGVAGGLEVKLTDFGIGQVVSEELLAGMTRGGFTETLNRRTSGVSGTQMYMAPELLAGQPASIRSDIYSLGVVLYQLVLADFSRPVTTDWMEDISDPLLRDDLKHCFAGHPAERFLGAGELARRLRTLEQRRQERARVEAAQAARERTAYLRGVWRTAAVALVVLLIVLSLALFSRHQMQRARLEARRAELSADKETQQRQRAETEEAEARAQLYAADMNLAQEAWTRGNLGRAQELLRFHLPAAGEPDVRNWEWRHLWDACVSDELATLGVCSNAVESIAVAPDGRMIAAGDDDGFVRWWEMPGRREILNEMICPSGVLSVAFSKKGDLFAATSWSGKVSIRRVPSFELVTNLVQLPRADVVSFSPDDKTIALATIAGVVFYQVRQQE